MIENIKKDFTDALYSLETFIHDDQNWDAIGTAGKIMVEALKKGNKIISCGNGGSLCDAMHFAEELTGRFHESRVPLPAIAISDSTHITCVGNDFGFEFIFSRSVDALGNNNDVLLAISTSGSSKNIVNAAIHARKKGMSVIALTGRRNSILSEMSNVEICAPFGEYSDRAQEIHIIVIHSLIHYIELSLLNHKNPG
jgi:D-sedoheptulose 7-phosphate isomerase